MRCAAARLEGVHVPGASSASTTTTDAVPGGSSPAAVRAAPVDLTCILRISRASREGAVAVVVIAEQVAVLIQIDECVHLLEGLNRPIDVALASTARLGGVQRQLLRAVGQHGVPLVAETTT